MICWGRRFDNCLNFHRVRSKAIAAVNVFDILDRKLNNTTFAALKHHLLDAKFDKLVLVHKDDHLFLHLEMQYHLGTVELIGQDVEFARLFYEKLLEAMKI